MPTCIRPFQTVSVRPEGHARPRGAHPRRRRCNGRKQGAAGFTKATQEVSSYQTPVSNLMKAIAAVIVLVGAFNVYFKMQNGDQDVKKTIMLTIGGCIAFIALSEALPLFFT